MSERASNSMGWTAACPAGVLWPLAGGRTDLVRMPHGCPVRGLWPAIFAGMLCCQARNSARTCLPAATPAIEAAYLNPGRRGPSFRVPPLGRGADRAHRGGRMAFDSVWWLLGRTDTSGFHRVHGGDVEGAVALWDGGMGVGDPASMRHPYQISAPPGQGPQHASGARRRPSH